MARYTTPFLVLNLGSEMIFVVAQRLQAQNVSAERTKLVLDELISVLTSKPLITSLMRPQSPYSQKLVHEIIEDISQSSVMRLDETSMSKLWDLITMVFKWQVTVGQQNSIAITLRHLDEIEQYTTNPNTLLQIHRVRTLVENFNKMLTHEEKVELRHHILYWLRETNVRVSLLLKMGLQSNDGSFIIDDLSVEAENMLQNVGENVYLKNYKFAEKNNNNCNNNKAPEINELDLFVGQILGNDPGTKGEATAKLRLNIKDSAGLEVDDGAKEGSGFSPIQVTLAERHFSEILEKHDEQSSEDNNCSFKDDLVAMIGESMLDL